MQSGKTVILLVEDEILTAVTEKQDLEKRDYIVHLAENGENAVKTISEDRVSVDLILMDIDLGEGMDGTLAAEQILRNHDIPVVFLSSHTEPDIVEKTEKITSYGYVVKNSGMVVLDTSIKMALKLFKAKNEHNRVEAALRKSEDKFKYFFESSSAPKSITMPGGEMSVNRAFCDLLGYTCKELENVTWQMLTPQEEIGPIQKILDDLISGESDSVRFTKRYIHKNQSIIWADLSTTIRYDDEGRPLYFMTTVLDITEQKQAEEKLRQSENRFRRAIESAPFPVMIHSENGNVLALSEGWTAQSGYSIEDIPTISDWAEKVYGKSKDSMKKRIGKIHKSSTGKDGGEYTITCKDGTRRIWDFSSASLGRLLDGRHAAISMAKDVTEKKLEEEKIQFLNDRLHVLIEAIQKLVTDRDLESVMEDVRTYARKLVNSDGVTFVLRDGDKCFYADEDAVSPLWKGKRFPMTDCISGWVMENREQAVIEDIYSDTRIPAEVYRPTFVKSMAMVPIRTQDPVGAIGSYWARQYVPTEIEMQLLQTLSDSTARVMENIGLIDELKQHIAEQKKGEEALREEECKFHVLFDRSLDGILVADIKTHKFIFGNKAICQMLGYTAEELLLIGVKDIHPPENLNNVLLQFSLQVRGDIQLARDIPVKRKDASVIYADINSSTITLNGREYLMGSFRDITRRKQAEEELRNVLLRQKALIDGIPDIIMEVDADRVYTWANTVGYEFFGDDVIGKEASNYFEGEQKTYEAVQPLFGGDENIIYIESWQRRRDGVKRLLAWWCRVLKGDDGNVIGALSTARDITCQKLAEEEIQRQLSEKEILLREVHHRIKNNIANVEMLLSMQAESQSSPEVRSSLQEAVTRVQSMRLLYERLLIGNDYNDVSLKTYIESLIDSILRVFPVSEKITLEKMIDDFSVSAKTATSIGIIFNELLTNVYNHAFTGLDSGNVLVTLEKTDNIVILTVRDDGTGMDERNANNSSTGFGLTIVKMLAEQLNGSFRYCCDNGTTSVVEIKL